MRFWYTSLEFTLMSFVWFHGLLDWSDQFINIIEDYSIFSGILEWNTWNLLRAGGAGEQESNDAVLKYCLSG